MEGGKEQEERWKKRGMNEEKMDRGRKGGKGKEVRGVQKEHQGNGENSEGRVQRRVRVEKKEEVDKDGVHLYSATGMSSIRPVYMDSKDNSESRRRVLDNADDELMKAGWHACGQTNVFWHHLKKCDSS